MYLSKILKLTIPAALLSAMTVQAAHVTPDEALRRALGDVSAQSVAGSISMPTLALTVNDRTDRAALYVMSHEGEYLVLPADDCAPALLGYGDNFNPADIPANMQWWLDQYAAQIKYMADNGIKYQPKAVNHAEIPYMVKTIWNQSTPFNNLCPTLNGSRSVTGCVATAMAQVINYHRCPADYGTGTHSYTWQGKTLTFDYGSTKFDWANMIDSYKSSYTNAQATAVATLMYAAGVSVNMGYSPSSSGAVSLRIPYALVNYFGFDPSARYVERDYYSEEDWDALVYGELEAGRPVIYSGQSNSGGHCFVCDGYRSNGYYHINWGWGGSSDGYFLLAALDPYNQGIGGSGDGSGFNTDQDIIINIKPRGDESSEAALTLLASGGFEYTTQYHAYWFGSSGGYANGFFNYSPENISIIPGVELTGTDDSVQYLAGRQTDMTGINDSGSISGSVLINSYLPYNIEAGTYHAAPVARRVDGTEWQPIAIPYGMTQYVTVRVADNGAVTYDGSDPSTLPAPCYTTGLQPRNTNPAAGENITVSATFTNPGTAQATFNPALMVLDANGMLCNDLMYYSLNLAAGNKTTYNLSMTMPDVPDGVYDIRVLNYAISKWASEPARVYVGIIPTSVSVSPDILSVEVDETADIAATVLPEDAFDRTVTWTSSDESIASVDDSGVVTGLAEGEVTVTATTINGLTARADVTVKKSTGIDRVSVDAISGLKVVYDINGRCVGNSLDNLAPGIYIVRQGSDVTKQIVK